MWLAYVGERKAHNLTSAVESLAQDFDNLVFDAEHEAEYGFDRFYTYEECIEIARKYQKAFEVCHIYLHTSDIRSFLYSMKEMEYENFLDEVKKFTPEEIILEVFGNQT